MVRDEADTGELGAQATMEDTEVGSPPPSRMPDDEAPEDDALGGDGHHLLELWSDREEVHALPEILRPAEGLVAVGSGTVVKSGRLSQSRWLVVVTDRRLLCIKGRHPVTRKVIDMPISAVRSVESKGLWRKMLVLETGYGTLRISGVKKSVAAEMVRGLTALMGSFSGKEEGRTAIRRAELPKAQAGGADPEMAEKVSSLGETVAGLETEMKELRDQVAFLDGLVRANVESGTNSQGDSHMDQV